MMTLTIIDLALAGIVTWFASKDNNSAVMMPATTRSGQAVDVPHEPSAATITTLLPSASLGSSGHARELGFEVDATRELLDLAEQPPR